MQTDLGPTWNNLLKEEIQKDYYQDLSRAVSKAYKDRSVFPSEKDVFNAFKLCPVENVKVVILGQDPYHGEGQAHGLSFSVPDGTKIPPSLRNIYKEIASDLGKEIPESGNLEHWAKQGVLLLNATLTVEEGQAGFHQDWGWENFTDEVVKTISDNHVYKIKQIEIVNSQISQLLIKDKKELILTTCYPFNSLTTGSKQRLVVYASKIDNILHI